MDNLIERLEENISDISGKSVYWGSLVREAITELSADSSRMSLRQTAEMISRTTNPTPRTDAAELEEIESGLVSASLCRELELEIAAVRLKHEEALVRNLHHGQELRKLRAALREIFAGSLSQTAHSGMSWMQVGEICAAALRPEVDTRTAAKIEVGIV